MFGRTHALLFGLLFTAGIATRVSGQETTPVTPPALHATAYIITTGNAGTGCLIDVGHGLVLTCHHVVADSDSASVVFPVRGADHELNLNSNYYRRHAAQHAIAATVIARDVKRDLALLELHRLPPQPVALRLAAESVRPGDGTLRLGSPAAEGDTWKVTPGIVKQAGLRTFNYPTSGQHVRCHILATDGLQRSGDSGGPVLNSRGDLVGINAAAGSADKLALAIDLSEIRAFLAPHRPVQAARAGATTVGGTVAQ